MLPAELGCSFYGYDYDLEKAKLILFGVPYYEKAYGGKPSIPPTSFLRILSKYVEDNYIDNEGYYSSLIIRDIGDIQSSDEDDVDVDIQTIVEYALKHSKKTIMLGGSHMYTYYVLKHSKPEFLIVLDAHLDLKKKLIGHVFSHATYLRRVVEENIVKKICIVGARAYEEEEKKFAEENDIILWTSVDEVINELESGKSFRAYISVDLDHLDPSHMPHVTNPEPLGLHPRDTFRIFSIIRKIGFEVIGGDVVEYSPYTLDIHPGVLASRITLELARTVLKT